MSYHFLMKVKIIKIMHNPYVNLFHVIDIIVLHEETIIYFLRLAQSLLITFFRAHTLDNSFVYGEDDYDDYHRAVIYDMVDQNSININIDDY